MSLLGGGWCNACERYDCPCGRALQPKELTPEDKRFEEAILKREQEQREEKSK